MTKSEKNTVLWFGKLFQLKRGYIGNSTYSAVVYFRSVCLLFLSFVIVVDHVVVVFIVLP